MAKAFGAARFGGGSVDEDTGIGSDEDFVELIPPPAEKYDPEWRLKPAEFPPRCPHCKNWIGNVLPGSECGEGNVHQQHILNGCRCFSTQGRYKWRHTAVLNYIDGLMDRNSLRVYSDLPERRTEADMTVPDQLLGQEKFADLNREQLTPDMVFFSQGFNDDRTFTVGVLEISLPWDVRVEASRLEKQGKNRALVEALTAQTRTPVIFLSIEIGSFHQRLSEGTKASIKELHTFTDQSVPYRTFKHRILRLAEFASFQLYSTRFETEWLPFSPYLELPPELADVDADKDNISSESGEAISLSSGVSGHTSGSANTSSEQLPPPTTTTQSTLELKHPSHPPPPPPPQISDILAQCSPPPSSNSTDTSSSQQPVQSLSVKPKSEVASSSIDGVRNSSDQEFEEHPAFSLRTKVGIYGTAATAVAYVIYNYWHIILMCILCLIIYEVWDKFGHRFSKSASKAKSE